MKWCRVNSKIFWVREQTRYRTPRTEWLWKNTQETYITLTWRVGERNLVGRQQNCERDFEEQSLRLYSQRFLFPATRLGEISTTWNRQYSKWLWKAAISTCKWSFQSERQFLHLRDSLSVSMDLQNRLNDLFGPAWLPDSDCMCNSISWETCFHCSLVAKLGREGEITLTALKSL